MSLYGMMRTGVSGMQAQSTRLSAVSDNIANSGTTGYKRSSVEFATLLVPSTSTFYGSGAVVSNIRHVVTEQGVLNFSSQQTDLAIDGEGFFVVRDAAGTPFLTRAGSFVLDGEGRLVNAAGFYLTGYSYNAGDPAPVANGFDGLEVVTIDSTDLMASATTSGKLTANLNYAADIASGDLPSANLATSEYTHKSSMIVYDNAGDSHIVDLYFTKTADNTWEVAAYDKADASATGFPYSSGPLSTTTLTFDPTTGKLDSSSATSIDFTVLNGQPTSIDLSDSSELATDFQVLAVETDGHSPAGVESISFDADGTLSAVFADGSTRPLFRIPLATAVSENMLAALPGNVFQASSDSGDILLGFPTEAGFGGLVSGALESSTVDIAEELTDMIQAERAFSANSKVFQSGSEMMEILVNLKR